MRGFTLIELIIILAITLLLAATVGTLSSNTFPKNQLINESDTVVQTLHRAQALTIAGKHDLSWGVHLSATQMTLFAGSSYALRNTLYDEEHEFPSGLTVSGLSDVVFVAITGETTNTGTITLTADATSETKIISVNVSGLIEK